MAFYWHSDLYSLFRTAPTANVVANRTQDTTLCTTQSRRVEAFHRNSDIFMLFRMRWHASFTTHQILFFLCTIPCPRRPRHHFYRRVLFRDIMSSYIWIFKAPPHPVYVYFVYIYFCTYFIPHVWNRSVLMGWPSLDIPAKHCIHFYAQVDTAFFVFLGRSPVRDCPFMGNGPRFISRRFIIDCLGRPS